MAALALVVALLPACSLFGDKEAEVRDEPADRLYNEGLYLLNQKRDAAAAAKKFEEVDRQHPYSEWARKSLIMTAYAFYEAGMYDDCINAARRYVTLHPGSPDAAYALMQSKGLQPSENKGSWISQAFKFPKFSSNQ